jgi:hypothetical protein
MAVVVVAQLPLPRLPRLARLLLVELPRRLELNWTSGMVGEGA